jgi:superfamily I DNA/RNA helicase
VTFTNKAANEMKERLLSIADEIVSAEITDDSNKTEDKIKDDDSIGGFLNAIQSSSSKSTMKQIKPHELKWIGTFHSIFLKIMKEDIDKLELKYNKNFGILDTNETQMIIKDVLKRLNLQEVYKPNEVKGFISTQKNN